jgi:DNA-directed RNA polymerase specialized sigma24 family protein
MEQVFCRLPYHFQQLIKWHAFDQLEYDDIAKRLGTTTKTARNQVKAAVAALRILLKM